jgi:septal ring factor EnvC (AmiA/AmiB activator)
MHDTESTSWIEQLEVTGPIKSIMGFVDELSLNYDRRIDAMHADYQKDIEEIIVCYKEEKQEFETQIANRQEIIDGLKKDLEALQQSFKTLNVEYKMTQDCLETSKQELAELTKELKKEDDLIALAKERIRAANAQIKFDLDTETEPRFSSPKLVKSSKTKEFFKLIMEARLSRTILLRPKQDNSDETLLEEQEKDTFSY